MSIRIFFNDSFINVPETKRLKEFIAFLFQQEGRQLSSLNYIFCSDKYLLSMNQEFLKHDNYTDILTFSFSEPPEPIVGEIYMSTERIRENAARYGVGLKSEIYRVMFHGALHLCGYRDKSPKEKERMTDVENRYITKFLE